jgi:predicted RNA methylase
MIVAPSTLALLRRAMLPMDGTIADHAETILAAVADAVPSARRDTLSYVDLTAGSCLLPLAFAAAGARSVIVNDIAARSAVAARALFHGDEVTATVLEDACAGRCRLRMHVPSFDFASDYLTADACTGFDRLFHADLPRRQSATLRYLAVRDILGFADPDDGFRILMTHDHAQLRAATDADWHGFLAHHDGRAERLETIRAALAAARAALRTTTIRVLQADMRDIAGRLDYGAPCLVAVNPPTNGIDEYVVEDQIIHSLIANRLVPLARCAEGAEAFWRRRVDAALAPLPSGTFFLVWGGDGALDIDACEAHWRRFGEAVHRASIDLGDGRQAVWGIFRRR